MEGFVGLVLLIVFIWLIGKFVASQSDSAKSNGAKSKAGKPSEPVAAGTSAIESVSGGKIFIGATALLSVVIAIAYKSIVPIALGVCIIFFFLYRIKSRTAAGAAGLLPNGEYAKHAVSYIYIILLCAVIYLLTRLSDESWRYPLGHALLVVYYFSILAAVFYFLRWFKRAYYNLRIKKQGLRFAAGWAVGAWFVPVANLWWPYEIMRELYDETAELLKNEQTTLAAKLNNSGWVTIWWVICIINAVIFIGVLIVTTAVYTTISSEFTVFMIIHHFAVIALSIASLKVIKDYGAAENFLSTAEEKPTQATAYVSPKEIHTAEPLAVTPKVAAVKAGALDGTTETAEEILKRSKKLNDKKTPSADQSFLKKLVSDYNFSNKNDFRATFYTSYSPKFFFLQDAEAGVLKFRGDENGNFMAVFHEDIYYICPALSLCSTDNYSSSSFKEMFGHIFDVAEDDVAYGLIKLITPAIFIKTENSWKLEKQGKVELTPVISLSRHERETNIADTHKPAEREEAEPPLFKTPADQPFKEKLAADYNSGDKNAFYGGYKPEFFSVQKQGGEPVFKSSKNGYYMAALHKGSYYVTPKFSLIYNADCHTACAFGAVFGIFKCDAVYDRVELVTPAVFTKEGDVWTLVQQGELDLSHRK